MRHPKTEILSEYLDGGLAPGQLQEVEIHLEGCSQCRELVDDLREIQSRARALPDQFPQRDLWPEISQALTREGAQEAEIIRLHPGLEAPGRGKRTRGFRISYLQAAAALVLAFGLGMGGAFVGNSLQSPPSSASGPGWAMLAEAGGPELSGMAEEIGRLESLLSENSRALDSSTIELLERNLEVIDRAIEESLRALEKDPGNRFLEHHLARAVESKVSYLREATAMVVPTS